MADKKISNFSLITSFNGAELFPLIKSGNNDIAQLSAVGSFVLYNQISGATNQISVTNNGRGVTLSTPQNLDTAALVQFANLGLATNAGTGIYIAIGGSAGGTAGTSYAVRSNPFWGSGAITSVNGFYSIFTLQPATANTTTARLFWAGTPTLFTGRTITTMIGLDIDSVTAGTINYAIRTGTQGRIQLNSISAKGIVYTDVANNLSAFNLNDGQLLVGSTGNVPVVTVLSGVSNQISATNSPGSILLSIDSNYIGQTSINTLGTIGSGTWKGSVIHPKYGGTGLSTSGTANQILGANSSGTLLEYKTLIAGSNITITHGANSITIDSTGGGGGIGSNGGARGLIPIYSNATNISGSTASSIKYDELAGVGYYTIPLKTVFSSTVEIDSTLQLENFDDSTRERIISIDLHGNVKLAESTDYFTDGSHPVKRMSTLNPNTIPIVSAGGAIASMTSATNGQILIGITSAAPIWSSIQGTTNQLLVTNNPGGIILSIDSNYIGQTSINTVGSLSAGTWKGSVIHPKYGGTGLSTSGTSNQILGANSSGTLLEYKTVSAGNNITITNGTNLLTFALDSNYIGQTSINTVGSISAGTWKGTKIDTAHGGTNLTTTGSANQLLGMNNAASGYAFRTLEGTDNILIDQTSSSIFITIGLDPGYPGQTSISTLGTIGTGIWNGTLIDPIFGGTGLNALGTDNQLLGVNVGASSLEYKTLSAGNFINIVNSPNSILIGTFGLTQYFWCGRGIYNVTDGVTHTDFDLLATPDVTGNNLWPAGNYTGGTHSVEVEIPLDFSTMTPGNSFSITFSIYDSGSLDTEVLFSKSFVTADQDILKIIVAVDGGDNINSFAKWDGVDKSIQTRTGIDPHPGSISFMCTINWDSNLGDSINVYPWTFKFIPAAVGL